MLGLEYDYLVKLFHFYMRTDAVLDKGLTEDEKGNTLYNWYLNLPTEEQALVGIYATWLFDPLDMQAAFGNWCGWGESVARGLADGISRSFHLPATLPQPAYPTDAKLLADGVEGMPLETEVDKERDSIARRLLDSVFGEEDV